MGYSNTAGLNVFNHYGSRTTGGAVGSEKETGNKRTMKIDITGQSIADAIAGFVPPVYLPKYANLDKVTLVVDEAFVVTGTTPALSIGSSGSVGTDYVSFSKAELEAVGTKAIASTGAGTWAFSHAAGLAAAAKVGFALTGTTPAIAATSGKATIIIEYTANSK